MSNAFSSLLALLPSAVTDSVRDSWEQGLSAVNWSRVTLQNVLQTIDITSTQVTVPLPFLDGSSGMLRLEGTGFRANPLAMSLVGTVTKAILRKGPTVLAESRFQPTPLQEILSTVGADLTDDGRVGTPTLNFLMSRVVDTPSPVLSLSPLARTVPEGNTGIKPLAFVVKRSSGSGTSSVSWAVSGTGPDPTNDFDFLGDLSGTVAFASGQTSATLTVNLAGDTTLEPNEAFSLALSAPVGATLNPAASSATAIITNDDSTVSIAALSATKTEGGSGSTPFTFVVNRSGSSSGKSTVRWDVSFGETTDATDFKSGTPVSGTVTFASGQTSRTLTINVNGDRLQEGDDTFFVSLSSPVGTALMTASASATILNDDWIGDGLPDNLIGTEQADFFDGRANVDTLTGKGGNDVFGFRFATAPMGNADSPLGAPDSIVDFAFGADKIALLSPTGASLPKPTALSRAADNSAATTLSELTAAVFADANGKQARNQPLRANQAALVVATNPAIAGTYVLINDATAGRSESADLLIKLSGFSGALPALGSIAPASLFV